MVVQPYVAGRNVRASFLAVEPQAGAERLAAVFVDSGADFQTMADSLALYGETGASAKAEGKYEEPKLRRGRRRATRCGRSDPARSRRC